MIEWQTPEVKDTVTNNDIEWQTPDIQTSQVYDADRGITVDVPNTFDENDTRFAIGTQIDKQPKQNFMAKTNIGVLDDVINKVGSFTKDLTSGLIS